MKLKEFFKEFAENVYYGEGDTDHPNCPKCSEQMNFTGGDLEYGDGYWKCLNCNYSFTERELNEHLDV